MGKREKILKVAKYLEENADFLANFNDTLKFEIVITDEDSKINFESSISLNDTETEKTLPEEMKEEVRQELLDEINNNTEELPFPDLKTRLKMIEPELKESGFLIETKHDLDVFKENCIDHFDYGKNNPYKKYSEQMKGQHEHEEDEATASNKLMLRKIFFMKEEDLKAFKDLVITGEMKRNKKYCVKSAKTKPNVRKFGYYYILSFKMKSEDFKECCKNFNLRSVDGEMKSVVKGYSARVFN